MNKDELSLANPEFAREMDLAMNPRHDDIHKQDCIAWEAFGALQNFAETNPACPAYLRDMVTEYKKRLAEVRAAAAGQGRWA